MARPNAEVLIVDNTFENCGGALNCDVDDTTGLSKEAACVDVPNLDAPVVIAMLIDSLQP